MSLPLHGAEPVRFAPEPDEARAALADALAAQDAPREARLKEAVAAHPTLLEGWGRLAEHALADDRPVDAYAYARVGYHRGLDRARQSGWRGQGPIPGDHEPNRGFLRSVRALGQAAQAIGEDDEALRCATFLGELDPDGALARLDD